MHWTYCITDVVSMFMTEFYSLHVAMYLYNKNNNTNFKSIQKSWKSVQPKCFQITLKELQIHTWSKLFSIIWYINHNTQSHLDHFCHKLNFLCISSTCVCVVNFYDEIENFQITRNWQHISRINKAERAEVEKVL